METLDTFALDNLSALEARGTKRALVETHREDGITAYRNGKRLISFSCNDYLCLSQHPAVKQAAIDATARYGVGAGASRLVTGNHPLYRGLEDRLARLKHTEAALVFGSGYLANLAIVPALAGSGDLVIIDELAHACMFSGSALSGARQERFRHNDLDDLAARLGKRRASYGHCLILTDHVFSMDGDLAPLPQIAALARQYDAWLLADDAHGIGVLPLASPHDVPLQMGTLSKAVGTYGGYLCASSAVVTLLQNRGRAFVYSTGLPPATIAASSAALDLITADPEWAASPLRKARRFAASLGLPVPQSQILPLIIGDSSDTIEASRKLEAAGFLVAAIRPPTVPAGTARLRISFTAGHTDDQIAALAEALHRIVPMTRP